MNWRSPEARFNMIEMLADGTMTAMEAADACRAVYSRWEPALHAFAWFDHERVRARAAELDAGGHSGRAPIFGIPVGVKDIFDTAGIPTEYGSHAFRGRVPTKSALAVSRLEAAGAVMFGKTVTAELAYFAPGPTTNPWNPSHTPGGSSMGSAAAVAAGVVPIAIGTQTNGSVIRPAAFCGVVGFKPTAGRLSTAGVLRFSPSLDQLGVFALSVEACARVAAIMAGDAPPTAGKPHSFDVEPPSLALIRTAESELAEANALAQFEAAVDALRSAGAAVREVELPSSLSAALAVHRTIMAVEASQFIGPLLTHANRRVSPQLAALLDEGFAISDRDYRAALNDQTSMRSDFQRWSIGFDALVTVPALGEAPPVATTGDPRCCTRWTLVGAPALTVPTGLGPNRLPLGMQIVGKIDQDPKLLEIGRWIEAVLPAIGIPPSPRAQT